MECSIEYVGKSRQGIKKYYCTNHKDFAFDKEGNKLDKCLCNYKKIFENQINIKDNPIKDLRIVYTNILENTKPEIFINGDKFDGTIIYNDSILTYKDLSGIMLSRLNDISVENVECNHCHRKHSDNGKFAYTPHRIHLCLYCGHLFRAKEKNVGNELSFILEIPNILLKNEKLCIKNNCCIEYDLLNGDLLINNKNVNTLIVYDKEIKVVDFLNDILQNEF